VLAGPEEVGLAALTLSHGARLATADRGFGRFPGLQHFDPLG
jgi:predicted nucleic acid-binding protein